MGDDFLKYSSLTSPSFHLPHSHNLKLKWILLEGNICCWAVLIPMPHIYNNSHLCYSLIFFLSIHFSQQNGPAKIFLPNIQYISFPHQIQDSLFFYPPLGFGGSQRFFINIITHQVQVISPLIFDPPD